MLYDAIVPIFFKSIIYSMKVHAHTVTFVYRNAVNQHNNNKLFHQFYNNHQQ